MITIEQLYECYEKLCAAKDKVSELEGEFLTVMEGVKGGPREKKLASQVIARFYMHFPDLAEKSINAQLDLCEDEDVAIRKQAIKDLPALCKDSPSNLTRIADVLTQLMQTDDPKELTLVQNSLVTLLKRDIKGTLLGVFPQITSEDDVVREKAIQFLQTKIKPMAETIPKDVEDFIVDECKKVLQDVTGEEFVSFMELLSCLRTMSTVQGRTHLTDIVVEQAGIANGDEFDALNPDVIERLNQCTKIACDLFSKNVHSTKFVAYYCDHVLPAMEHVPSPDAALELLRYLATMSPYCPDLTDLPQRVDNLFSVLLSYMPLPPPPKIEDEETAAVGNGDEPTEPKLQFSAVECLMFAFHQIARRLPDFMSGPENEAKLKDFRLRLQYFARGVQLYDKQLRSDLTGKTGEALKTDEAKLKVAALKTTSNISSLVKDLFRNPPSYKAVLEPSWKKPAVEKTGLKRTTSTEASPAATRGAKAARGTPGQSMKMYAPPTGRYSGKTGSFDDNSGTGGYGQQRRGGGGRGGGRGNRGGWRGGRGWRRGGYQGQSW